MLHPVSGTTAADRVADIVFVHGLNPQGILKQNHAFSTWGGNDLTADFAPKWLGEDLGGDGLSVGIWILEYDAAALGWLGTAMPLNERASNVLDALYGEGIGQRPIIFIGHSLGGLVIKQLLHRSVTIGKRTESPIGTMTRAVVFLATPHTGADIASFVTKLGSILRQTDALKGLVANAAPLRELADWYLNQSVKQGILTHSYYEKLPTKPVGLVVDETSADPHVAGASAVPVDANHSDIARFQSRNQPHYKSMKRFIADVLRDSITIVDPDEYQSPVVAPKGNDSESLVTQENIAAYGNQEQLAMLSRMDEKLTTLVSASQAMDIANGESSADAARRDLAVHVGRDRIQELKRFLETWEFQKAFAAAEKMRAWLSQNISFLPRALAAECYVRLAETEIARVKQFRQNEAEDYQQGIPLLKHGDAQLARTYLRSADSLLRCPER